MSTSFYKLLIWLFLLLALTCSGVAGYWMKLDVDAQNYQKFYYECEEIKLRIAARLKAHEQALLGGAALFDASDGVERQEWYAYVKRLHISEHFHGIQGLGFALWIPAAQLQTHQALVRAEGFANYKVHPEQPRQFYTSIVFLEPFAGLNLRAFGYDMYSEAVRRVAMARARDENRVTLSGKVILVQEIGKNVQAGTLMYAPVYKKNQPLLTVEQRRNALFGWVYSPFRMNNLLNDIVLNNDGNNFSKVHLSVYEGRSVQAAHLLYDNKLSHVDRLQIRYDAVVVLPYRFNGTAWTLQFEQQQNTEWLVYLQAWITLGTGTMISILLFLLLNSYLTTRVNAVAIAAKLTRQLQESESRFRVFADNAPVLIWLAGLDKKCYQFNKVWLDFTGRTLQQEQGDGWVEGVHSADVRDCLDTYMTAFEARLPFKMEYRLRRYDGVYRWILDCGVPRFTPDGSFLGYIGSCTDISERKQAEHALQRESEKNLAFLRNASDGIHIIDSKGNLIEFSDSFCTMLGYQREEMSGMNVKQWAVRPLAECLNMIQQQFANPVRSEFESQHRCKNGHIIDVEISGFPLVLDGQPVLFNSSRDITERKQAETQLRIAAAVFESQEGMFITNANGIILRANQAFSRITGYSEGEVIGKNPSLLRSGRHEAAFYAALWRSLQDNGAWQGEVWNRRKNGQIYPEWLTVTVVKGRNDAVVTHYVATMMDITERKAAEEMIQRLAFYDPLTQLPNRRLLHERLTQGIEVSRRTGVQMGVLMMDLDKFKAVNDSLGHAAGDELLQQVAQRVKNCLRKVDTVARLGGDEFVILIENIVRYEALAEIADTLIYELSQPFTLFQTYEVRIGASIGIAVHPQHGADVQRLMDNADAALYRAKDNGRGCFAYFSNLSKKAPNYN